MEEEERIYSHRKSKLPHYEFRGGYKRLELKIILMILLEVFISAVQCGMFHNYKLFLILKKTD